MSERPTPETDGHVRKIGADGLADGDFAHNLERERDALRSQLAAANARVISGFYEEQYPIFSQGMPTHELQEIATADELNAMVKRLHAAQQEIADLKDAQSDLYEINATLKAKLVEAEKRYQDKSYY